MNDVLQEILERVVRVETKIDTYNNYKQKTDDAYNKAIECEKDIAEMKDNIRWLWRTVSGALIASITGIIIKWGGVK